MRTRVVGLLGIVGVAGLVVATPMPVTAQPTYIYWAVNDLGEVWRALRACPTSSAERLLASLNYPGYIALDTNAGRMFVSEGGNDTSPDRIIRCSLSDCAGTVTPVVTGLNNPQGLALDTSAQLIYWAESGSVKRADALATNSNVGVVASGFGSALADLELAGGKLYWADEDNQTIWRADAAVGATPEAIVTGISASQLGPIGIAVDLTNGHVYWSEISVPNQKVYRTNMCTGGGCPVNCAPSSSGCEAIFTEPLGYIFEVDLDLPDGKVWWSTRSSGSIRFGALSGIPLSDQTANTLIGTGGLVQGIALSNEAAGGCPTCATAPIGCRTAGQFLLQVRDKVLNSQDRFTWKWGHGQKTDRVEFGNPASGSTSYTLCVYDESAGQPTLAMSATVPPGGTCAGKPCWTETSRGFKYRDRNLTVAGISNMTLNAGADGRARISVKGKGGNLPLPAPAAADKFFNQDSNVTVQLTGSGLPVCWGAAYSQPATKNNVDQFKDKQP